MAVLRELGDEARRDPALLARPVRVVVPSRSLRLHVAARAAAELGARAGLVVQTLHGAAVELLERAGTDFQGSDLLVELLARRCAREEEPLRRAFDAFRDGYRTVASSVRDLLDAGFVPETLGPALERLGEARLPGAELERAGAVLRVAARVASRLSERGLGGRSALLLRAAEHLRGDAQRVLPARLVVVHGFADATGCASDLLTAVARGLPTLCLVDLPSDPDDAAREDPGCVFARRFVERMEGALGTARRAPRTPERAAPTFARAPGPSAEARAVARAIRELLAAPDAPRPERVGVVARDLAGSAVALRRALEELGVPASSARARGELDGAGRALLALVHLVEERERAPTDRWLDALRRLAVERDGAEELRAPSPSLRLALRVAGAGRLGETAAVEPERWLDEKDRMRLPVRTGVAGGPGAGGAPPEPAADGRPSIGFHAPSARLHGADLRAAVRAASALARRLARWPERAPLSTHLEELERLRRVDLGWRAGDPAERRARAALERASEGFGDEELAADELAHLVRRALAPAAAPPFSIAPADRAEAIAGGGGVRVLDAMEARALTFDRLFLVGVNRDVFPRVVREDPLLGEGARRALADLLPDVPLAARGRDEDRYLFAQLVSSSPETAVSWHSSDDDGRPRVVSPLVTRLLGERQESEADPHPPLFPPDLATARAGGPRTAREHAVLGGLFRERREFESRAELALREARAPGDPHRVAAARGRVLAAHDRGPFEPALLAPWLGFLGSQEAVGVRPDPRREPVFVTRYEAMARCPWQTVLTRLLRLGETPDPLDELPGIEPRVVGNVTHKLVERLAARALGEPEPPPGSRPRATRDERPTLALADVLAREGAELVWPDDEELEELLLAAARDVVAEERPPTPGHVRMIAECARPAVLRAREFDRAEAARFGGLAVLGAEVTGSARVDAGGRALELAFRADRVERRGGATVLTDLKTGKPVKTRELLGKELPRGTMLQALVYVLGAAELGTAARGRYLFLAADGVSDETDVQIAGKHGEHLPALQDALGRLVDAWLAGTFFPRLLEVAGDKPPEKCRSCEVAQACLQGDSGARRALLRLARGEEPLERGGAELERLWQLAAAGGKEGA